MTVRSAWHRRCALLVAGAVLVMAIDVEARGGGGRGGGGRGGGGHSFSRGGPAGGGSFRGGQDYSRGGSRQARSGGGGRMAARQPGAGGGFGGQPSRGVAARRESAAGRRQDAASERGAQRDEAREDWQKYGKNRQEDRQDFWEDEVDDIDGVSAGSWGNVRVYDADDFWTGVAVVAVGSALTAAAFDAMRADSGCTMTQVKANGADYYYCAPNWYVRTMNGGTLTYMVVQPPPGH